MMKLLVCTQKRHAPNPHSCGNSGSESLADLLENALLAAGMEFTVERSPCMSMCVNGPNIRLLPEGKNWHRVGTREVDEIVAYLQQKNS